MTVKLTQDAAEHVNIMLKKRGSGLGLRLGIRVSGCTGYAYVVDYADEVGDKDTIFESHGVKVFVDQKSLPVISGMTVGFTKHNLLNQGFEFNNPNVEDSCGCGESFSIKSEAS